MKKTLLLIFTLFFINLTQAQQKAITETGEEVILYDDGTWKYQDEKDAIEKEIPTNSSKFTKAAEASFLLKSTKTNIGVYLNPKTWSFKKSGEEEESEFDLELKGGDLYGMIITEKVEIPLVSLKSIALENAKAVAPDAKIVNEEYRTVNGIKVLFLEMNGTLQGIKFSYYGYYYSSPNGTVQFITYTSQSLQNSYKAEREKLLNGLIEIK